MYLAELGEQFKDVILTLAESATVGLMCEGHDISRKGEVSLLAMSCRRGVYLFDLVEIGAQEALEAGLKEILESPHVLKVNTMLQANVQCSACCCCFESTCMKSKAISSG